MKKRQLPPVYRGASNEHQERVLEGVAIWAAYYRSNIHRFVEDYFHVTLKLFQIILLVMMDRCATFVLIACRGLGKTYLSAVFCCARAILYPGTKIILSSGTRGQSINVLEKVLQELVPNSPELANEIDQTKTQINNSNAMITFKNGSFLKVVTASDNARGNRAHILLLDEFRMIKKDVIDTILRKFQASPRHPGFLDLPEYKGRKDLIERNKTLYLSSAYYKDHWSYLRCKDSCRFMLDEGRANFVCGLPYQLAVQEDLLMEEDVIEQMSESDFNEIKWAMEMCAEFWGDAEGTFFNYDAIAKNRKIEYVMLPDSLSTKLPSSNKLRIPPKSGGERRILSVDVALMASTKRRVNDATAIFVNQLTPTRTGRYMNNIVYTESHEGNRTDVEALRVRRLFDEYECDYIVLDVKSFGLSVYDALASDITDSDTGEIYPALCCCNNEELAARCSDPNIPENRRVIWAVNGNPRFNSDCAILLREGFRAGNIRLPITEYDAEVLLNSIKGYAQLPLQDRMEMQLPYMNTTLLINELINLQHEESSGVVKITEKPTARKDRYSSLSYNYYVSTQLEKRMRRDESRSASYETDSFVYRAPQRHSNKRW